MCPFIPILTLPAHKEGWNINTKAEAVVSILNHQVNFRMKFYVEYQRRKIGIWVSSDTVKPQSRKNLLPCVSPLLSHYYTYTTFLTPEVWPFFPQLCDTSWVFYNLTNSDTTWIWHGIPQAKGLVPQDCIHNTLDTKSTSRLLTYAFD